MPLAALAAQASLCIRGDQPKLLVFAFHSLLNDEVELGRNQLEPFQLTTVDHLRQCIEYFQDRDYRFVTPECLAQDSAGDERLAMLTFDDGYANNLRAMPVLEAFNVPATFFISTDYIVSGKAFWWDVLYRERTRQGRSYQAISKEVQSLKALQHDKIEDQLCKEFGSAALMPEDDLDRPMTVAELQGFARHRNICLGNHTKNHAILVNYDRKGIQEQIGEAQSFLEDIIGAPPIAIAYPNGNVSGEVVSVARNLGLKVGFTTEARQNKLSEFPENFMTLARFQPKGSRNLIRQFHIHRSGLTHPVLYLRRH
jgi:peptidoglycan/xylan/chitin deacetylase (PgdA/CDA1 family)